MISYALQCSNGHQFDSQFKSSADYDRLQAANLLACPICDGSEITKALMAPVVAGTRQNKSEHPMEQKIREMKSELKKAKNVGWQFATEARAMHNGEKERAPIYGKTAPEDAVELVKEGVGIAPLPFDPDAKEN